MNVFLLFAQMNDKCGTVILVGCRYRFAVAEILFVRDAAQQLRLVVRQRAEKDGDRVVGATIVERADNDFRLRVTLEYADNDVF